MLRHADNFGHLTAAQLSRWYSTVDAAGGSIFVGPHGRANGDAIRFSGDRLAYIRRSSITTSGSVAILETDMRFSAAPASATPMFRVLVGTTVQASLALETDRKLKVYRGDLTTALGSASTYVVPVNTWVRICLKLTINDATGAALVHVWAAGDTAPQVVLNLTSQDTKAHASSALWDAYDLHAVCAGTTDYTGKVVTDGSGGVNDDLVSTKPRTAHAVRPNGDGAHLDWVPSSGLAHYPLVDDTAADDDAGKVGTDVEDDIDTYDVADVPDVSQTIHGAVVAVTAKHNVTAAEIGHVIRHAGTDTVSAAVVLAASYGAHLYAYDQIPGPVAFTPALFSALQFGVKALAIDASTRLYLASAAAGYSPATYRGSWDDTAEAITKALILTKNEAATATIYNTANHDTAAADRDLLCYRGVSAPLAAQTIAGNFYGVISAFGGAFADHGMRHHVHMFVTVGDSDTVRGTLVSNYIDSTTWVSIQGQEIPTQAVSSLAVSDGDRLVIEFGARTSQMAVPAFEYYAQIGYHASSSKPDATHLDGAGLGESVSWVEFEDGLVFQ